MPLGCPYQLAYGHAELRLEASLTCAHSSPCSADSVCVFQYEVAGSESATSPNENCLLYRDLFDCKAFSLFEFRWKEGCSEFRMEIEITGDDTAFRAIVGKVLTADCFGKRESKSRVVSLNVRQ